MAQPDGNISASATPLPFQAAVAGTVLIISTFLLFLRLGHYALWDDEAYTALMGQSIWHTGDTNAVIGHNIVAYRAGVLLTNLKDRYVPPLCFYLDAPFAEFANGGSALPRVPFAACGVLTIATIFWWLHRDQARWNVWILMGMAIVGNVSLFLYFRQARYYGSGILLTILIAYHWRHFDGRRWRLILLCLLGAALLTNHYVMYAAVVATGVVDYFLFARKNTRLSSDQWLSLILSQLIWAAVIVPIWNPLLKHPNPDAHPVWTDRFRVLWWLVRDMDVCEFGATIFWAICPLIYFLNRNKWFLRAPLALAVYVLILAACSPLQDMTHATRSDVRFASPIIPLYLAIAAMVLAEFRGRWAIVGIAIGCIAFGTNLLEGGPLLDRGFHSTLVQYVQELADPPPDPYRTASDWINANVTAGRSIWALPDYTAYPLMYHAPQAIYAYQLKYPPEKQFRDLPAINFVGRALPDFVITFGPVDTSYFLNDVQFPPGIRPVLLAAWPVNGRAVFRPELFWRSFRALPCDLKNGEGIYCFKLLSR